MRYKRMNPAFFNLLAVVVVAGAALTGVSPNAAPDRQLSGDYGALQGTWIVTHNEIAQVAIPEMLGRQFVFEGRRFHLDGDSGAERFSLDETTAPKKIDFIDESSVIRGIYKLQEDVLTLCTSPPGVDRPTRFVTTRDSRVTLTIVERQKAAQ